MYFSNIFNREIEKVVKSIKYNGVVPLDEINTEAWVIEEHDSILRLFPLFNCDNITSSNDNDVIIDNNKVLICENLDDTILNIDGSGLIQYNGINLLLYAINDSFTLSEDENISMSIIAADNNNKPIPELEILLKYRNNGSNTKYNLGTVNTNSNGEASYEFNFETRKDLFNFETSKEIYISAEVNYDEEIFVSNEIHVIWVVD